MSIRLQLLSIALTTLLLPWAGCQYARELEDTLRLSQENSLQVAADTIAHALSSESGRVFADEDDGPPFDAAIGDVYAYPLHAQPLLDGYREDWGIAAPLQTLPTSTGLAARELVAYTERYLYLYLEVDDPTFDPEPNDPPPEQGNFDRVEFTVMRPDGTMQSFFLAAGAPGPALAQAVVLDDSGAKRLTLEPRIQAFWLQSSRGYAIEARIPRSIVGSRLWLQAIDAATGRTAGFTRTDPPRGGRLFMATPGLDEVLATFVGPGTEATVIDANALKLGMAGSLRPEADADPHPPTNLWYRRLIAVDMSDWPLENSSPDRLGGRSVAKALAGHAAAQWLRSEVTQGALLSAAAPIKVDGVTRGAVVLQQAGDQLLDLRDRALGHLFNLTLLATAVSLTVAFGVATWISLRIARLRLAADTAVTVEGRIRLDMPESSRRDEIGALSRGFERLLGRLNEHTQYLRTLGAKLSHELRTPLTIVRSSLDNLESEGVRADQREFIVRARAGALRLQSILTALGAASRVEEVIKHADRTNFDLKALLQSTIGGYRDGFPSARFDLAVPDGSCFMRGAPDLVVQMLDKLIENAVDFCTAGGTISVQLGRAGANYEVSVANDGPRLPPDAEGRLFESLFEHRTGVDEKPHFGLGLYIVRLIAEFHGGRVAAADQPGGRGAVFTVHLPLI